MALLSTTISLLLLPDWPAREGGGGSHNNVVIGGSKGLHLNMERHHRSFVGGHHYTFELADDPGLGYTDDLDDGVGAGYSLRGRGGSHR